MHNRILSYEYNIFLVMDITDSMAQLDSDNETTITDWYTHHIYDINNSDIEDGSKNVYEINISDLIDKNIESFDIPPGFFSNDKTHIYIVQRPTLKSYTSNLRNSDIFQRLMDKLHGVKTICFECNTYCNSVLKMPSTLIKLWSHSYIKFNLDECINLKEFMISAQEYHNSDPYKIPKLPEGIESLSVIHCNRFDESINRLPSTIKKIHIECSTLGANIETWPINLQELNILIASTYQTRSCHYVSEYSIGLLPHTLEIFKIRVYSYPFYIDFPSNLKTLQLGIEEYPHSLADIPDSIVNLACYYNKNHYFHKLPANCKNFVYLDCPGGNTGFRDFRKRYKTKGTAIYKRFINKIHDKIFMRDRI